MNIADIKKRKLIQVSIRSIRHKLFFENLNVFQKATPGLLAVSCVIVAENVVVA